MNQPKSRLAPALIVAGVLCAILAVYVGGYLSLCWRATPVASEAGAERFARAADKVVCLRREAELGPLDRYYGRAQQITHEEALDCLARAA
jgi:hypothetical protein